MLCNETLHLMEKKVQNLKRIIENKRKGVDNALLILELNTPLGILVENKLIVITSDQISVEKNILL